MSIKTFVRENAILTIGVVAPVLLMLIFFVAFAANHSLPGQANIKYDILLQQREPSYQSHLPVNAWVFVQNGHLYMQYTHNAQNTGTMPVIFLYEAVSGKLRRLDVFAPDVNNNNMFGKEILFEATKNFLIDTATTSPDGYEFTYGSSGGNSHGGIFGELFFANTGTYDFGAGLRKNGAFYRLPAADSPYGTRMELIGWVVARQE